MALTTTAAALATAALTSMYLDAKLLIRHDMSSGALAALSDKGVKYLAELVSTDSLTVFANLDSHAKSPTMASKTFLIFEGRTWTYRQFWQEVTRVGLWLLNDLNIQRGQNVALNGVNSPEYLMMWLGLDAIGAVPAFINCNLTSSSLVHCVEVCEVKTMLTGREVGRLVTDYEDDLTKKGCQIVWFDRELVEGLKPFDGTEIPRSQRQGLTIEESACLIYTSGTTGMPKATKYPRGKSASTSLIVEWYLGLKPGNIMYTCLPLYHGAAHGLCMTPSIKAGSTVVLSRKFSHKTFWPEVRESKADIIQYVGELCRYLVNAPPSSLDKQNNVQMAWGNGMRPDVWEVFRQRFDIPIINELYAASDGMGSSFNNNQGDFGKFAVGKRGALWRLVNNKREKRIKIDTVTQEIVRDANGFAIECADGEPGEVVHLLDPAKEKLVFAGYYNNDEASEKRKIRDLFQKGDYWFRSGDMMRQDPDGCVYFVDRLGDTFRWKSENVSTNEVGDVLGNFHQIAEANVYGVQVPNADGRCGCGAIVMTEGTKEADFDFAALGQHCVGILPRYAVPIFIRVVKELQYTGTMKVQKGKLRGEGVDLDKIYADDSCRDAFYWMPPGQSTYVPFKKEQWEELKGGKVRL